ncbi:MAG: alpha/beta hydrolase [Myxococcota bacterium]
MTPLSTEVVRRESSFRASDGLRLVSRSWRAAGERAARGRVVLVHGFGEHSGRYDEMAAWLVDRGFAVDAYDHRGHGLSEGHRNFVPRARGFDAYVDDLMTFLALLAGEREEAARILVGHSMGGLVVARALARRGPDVACAVISGAALAVSPGFSRTKQWLARALAVVAPRLAMESGLPVAGLSRDPEVVRRYEADPLVCTRMTAGLAAAMLRAQIETACEGSRVRVPLLGLHGADDPICPARGTERFLRDVATPRSAFEAYAGLRHEIFNEPERVAVWEDVVAFAAGDGEEGRA